MVISVISGIESVPVGLASSVTSAVSIGISSVASVVLVAMGASVVAVATAGVLGGWVAAVVPPVSGISVLVVGWQAARVGKSRMAAAKKMSQRRFERWFVMFFPPDMTNWVSIIGYILS
jgi:hypothetical protein